MRYLKQKIAKANEPQKILQSPEFSQKQFPASETTSFQSHSDIQVKIEIPCEAFSEENNEKRKPKRSLGNNVMKNYAAAMITFALSRLSDYYLTRLPLVRKLSLAKFRQILHTKRQKIHCIKSFRELLFIEDQDSEETMVCKTLFQEACKIFLKYFSVNWIYNSRLSDKFKYLKYRGKLLRRVQNPETFTYLETFSEKKPRQKKSKKNLKNIKLEVKSEF